MLFKPQQIFYLLVLIHSVFGGYLVPTNQRATNSGRILYRFSRSYGKPNEEFRYTTDLVCGRRYVTMKVIYPSGRKRTMLRTVEPYETPNNIWKTKFEGLWTDIHEKPPMKGPPPGRPAGGQYGGGGGSGGGGGQYGTGYGQQGSGGGSTYTGPAPPPGFQPPGYFRDVGAENGQAIFRFTKQPHPDPNVKDAITNVTDPLYLYDSSANRHYLQIDVSFVGIGGTYEFKFRRWAEPGEEQQSIRNKNKYEGKWTMTH